MAGRYLLDTNIVAALFDGQTTIKKAMAENDHQESDGRGQGSFSSVSCRW